MYYMVSVKVATAAAVLCCALLKEGWALPTGAPTAACVDITQRHSDNTPMLCADPCPFSIRVVEIDGDSNVPVNTYRCGSLHTLSIETSDANQPFRGFVIQARTASQDFSNNNEFQGQFIEPDPGSDWRIWDCAAPSATHTNRNDKTAVSVTWQAPGIPNAGSPENVSIWFSITRIFTNFHAQLRGPNLTADPASCGVTVMPPTEPVELQFMNDSPRVVGSTITADIQIDGSAETVLCALTGLPYQDCSSGTVTFSNVPLRDNGDRPYILRVAANTTDGQRTVIRRVVRPVQEDFCHLNLINEGVTVSDNSATIQFAGVGNFTNFLCDLDRQNNLQPCSSPQVFSDLADGDHRVKIVPSIAECGRNRRPLVITFAI